MQWKDEKYHISEKSSILAMKLSSQQTIKQSAEGEPESNTRDIVLTEEGAKAVLLFSLLYFAFR